jgi:hypothetical protein
MDKGRDLQSMAGSRPPFGPAPDSRVPGCPCRVQRSPASAGAEVRARSRRRQAGSRPGQAGLPDQRRPLHQPRFDPTPAGTPLALLEAVPAGWSGAAPPFRAPVVLVGPRRPQCPAPEAQPPALCRPGSRFARPLPPPPSLLVRQVSRRAPMPQQCRPSQFPQGHPEQPQPAPREALRPAQARPWWAPMPQQCSPSRFPQGRPEQPQPAPRAALRPVRARPWCARRRDRQTGGSLGARCRRPAAVQPATHPAALEASSGDAHPRRHHLSKLAAPFRQYVRSRPPGRCPVSSLSFQLPQR